ncbi:MAG TPA: DUF4129 domain-containing protein, partial [Polyangiaceae bacterium]|nr:DUF4129 domain-containing protein [Polyangiaceae bacterium]
MRRVAPIVVASLLFATRAGAATGEEVAPALTPARAAADVEAARRDKSLTFCSAPRKPLSFQARGLCPHAAEIPGCEGFAAACADTEPEKPPWWLERLLRSLAGATATSFARVLVWVVVALAVAAVLFPIALAFRRMRRDGALADAEPDEDTAAEPALDEAAAAAGDEVELLKLAEAHALRGEHSAALALYLAASLRALDKRGALRLARDRTNGEYVRLCTDTAARGTLRDLAREVDRVQFGREPATPDAVRRARERAESIVRSLPAVLGILAVLALSGCGAAGGAWAARNDSNDPAGDALLLDLLRRQGVSVE